MNPAIPISFVFIGCCLNNIFLELLVRIQSEAKRLLMQKNLRHPTIMDHKVLRKEECPSSGNIITISQFLFIALEGFIFSTNFCLKPRAIPLSTYFMMVLMFAVTSIVNNYALNFNISMPLHMIFRAGSLMANLVLGVILLKSRYTLTKYLSVLMITAGICLATVASAKHVKQSENAEGENDMTQLFWWFVGIGLLTFALFMSARMGIYQEVVYKRFGKHPEEALFYNHALPLPFFLLFSTDVYKHVILFSQSEWLELGMLTVPVPKMWLYLLGNVLTQYICIKSVFVLTTECTSLTVTLVVTLRKFVSLLLSIAYFRNPFTLYHWLGTVLVFGGTLLFTGVIPTLWNTLTKRKTTESTHIQNGKKIQ